MLTPSSTTPTDSPTDSHAQTCTRSASGRGSDVPVARYINTIYGINKVIRKGILSYESSKML